MKQDVYLEFSSTRTNTSLQILRRVADLLKRWPKGYRIVGGWGPYLLCKEHGLVGGHVGSIDIDVLLISSEFPADHVYERLDKDLASAGFNPDPANSCRWILKECVDDAEIRLDFLAPGFTHDRNSFETIHGVSAWKAYGTEFVPSVLRKSVLIAGKAWGLGDVGKLEISVPSGAALLVSKSITLQDRRHRTEERKPYKDAYDIFYLITSYRDGPSALIEEMRALPRGEAWTAAIEAMRENFGSPTSAGSGLVANFVRDVYENREKMAKYASEQVSLFVDQVTRE
jgi:hypothetical protein